MLKIGLVGNSCTGKTTTAFSLIAWLKQQRALVGYCTDTARAITFDRDRLDDATDARLHVLFRQLANETEQQVRRDVDYLITERTALDWYLYYCWTCANVGQEPEAAIEQLVRVWMRTYDLLVFMDARSMHYVDDGFRPATTKIRDEVEPLYQRALAELHETHSSNLIVIDGDDLILRNHKALTAIAAWLGNVNVRPTRAIQ